MHPATAFAFLTVISQDLFIAFMQISRIRHGVETVLQHVGQETEVCLYVKAYTISSE